MSQRSQVHDSVNESSSLISRNDSQINGGEKQISFFTFFRYLSPTDKCLLYLGTAASILAGMILPSISLIMGNVASAFSGDGSSKQTIID